jgi:hypothetical protein
MKNDHERFGRLVYRRRPEKTATNLRDFLDAFVGEERGKAHLVSVVGGDVEVGPASTVSFKPIALVTATSVDRRGLPCADSVCAFQIELSARATQNLPGAGRNR